MDDWVVLEMIVGKERNKIIVEKENEKNKKKICYMVEMLKSNM